MEERFKAVEEEVIERVRPTPKEDEELRALISALMERLNALLEKYTAGMGEIRAMLVGSVSKGTYLKDKKEADIFLAFREGLPKSVLEDTVMKVGSEFFGSYTVKYAEHPYVSGELHGLKIDLVPCYDIGNPEARMSAVDRTPFHTRFVNSMLDEKGRDEVRLLKAFFRGTGVYGAEARTGGFSGYLCELLVITYGTFRETLRKMAQWKDATTIVPPGATLGENLRIQKAPLYVPDPVDCNRNVAAAVSCRALAVASIASRIYSAEPDIAFFYPVSRRRTRLDSIAAKMEKSGHEYLLISISRPDIVEDNLYPQVMKARRNICALLEEYEFSVERSIFSVEGNIKFLIELRNSCHPRRWIREGPAGWSESATAFIRKHRERGADIFIEEGKVFADEPKPYTSPAHLIREMINGVSLGADLDRVKGTVEVASGRTLLRKANVTVLSDLLFPHFPWER